MVENNSFFLALQYMEFAGEGILYLLRNMNLEERTKLYEKNREMFWKYDAIISEKGSVDEMTQISAPIRTCIEFEKNPNVMFDGLFASYVATVAGIQRYIQLKNWE